MVEVQKSGNMLAVKAQGPSDYAAEVGQQLGWLGSALHVSPSTNAISYCSPVVNEIRRPIPLFVGEPWSDGSEAWFEIRFVLDQTDVISDSLNGQCWHGLFRNPVVARGYPIPRRSEYNTGLDIPLNILARLAQAHRATMFDGKMVIKGFSTMLVPTKRTEDMLIWHLLFNNDQRHISYGDHRVSSTQELYDESATVNDLERCRNILGWASVASNHAGKYNRLLNYTRLNINKAPRFLGRKLLHTLVWPQKTSFWLRTRESIHFRWQNHHCRCYFWRGPQGRPCPFETRRIIRGANQVCVQQFRCAVRRR